MLPIFVTKENANYQLEVCENKNVIFSPSVHAAPQIESSSLWFKKVSFPQSSQGLDEKTHLQKPLCLYFLLAALWMKSIHHVTSTTLAGVLYIRGYHSWGRGRKAVVTISQMMPWTQDAVKKRKRREWTLTEKLCTLCSTRHFLFIFSRCP